MAALALVGGAAVSAWSAHQQDVGRRATQARLVHVLAVAQPPALAQLGRTTAASVRVSLINLGQEPVEIITSPPGVRVSAGATVVGLANGTRIIEPGHAEQAVALVGVSCAADTPVTPALAVRGPDGREQPVTVRDANLDTYQVRPRQVCGVPDGTTLTSRLAGTVRAPLLVVRNASHHDMAITLDPDSGVAVQPPLDGGPSRAAEVGAIGPEVSVSTVPRLPVVLPAGQEIALTLAVHVRGCQPLGSLQGRGYLLLLGVPVAVEHSRPPTQATAADLTTLIGSQQTTACS